MPRCHNIIIYVIIKVHSELSSFIHVSSIHCWCDFMIVLQCLNGDGTKKEVSARRTVEEVHKLVDVDC